MTNFETSIIDTTKLVEQLIYVPLRLCGLYLVLVVVIKLLFYRGKSMSLLGNMPIFIFTSFKAIIYGFVAAIVFFFDFTAHQFSFFIPQKMYLSTFLVGCFSLYEAISNIIELVRIGLNSSKN